MTGDVGSVHSCGSISGRAWTRARERRISRGLGAALIDSKEPTQAEAPNDVRSAERAAVAKRGRRAAEKAATESAEAAKSALAASTLAEASATKTDAAATLAGLSTLANFADARAEMGVAATATAKAAMSALAASTLAETSSSLAAIAARLAGLSTQAALADAEAEARGAEGDEATGPRRDGGVIEPRR